MEPPKPNNKTLSETDNELKSLTDVSGNMIKCSTTHENETETSNFCLNTSFITVY